MTAHRRPGRHRTEDDSGFVLLLREGQGHQRCYDVFAPELYRYCWALLGPGPTDGEEDDAPGSAVREAFLAAVELLPWLRDRNTFRPWLFALARTACQRRGLARSTPYGTLPAAAEERPIINTLLQLPPSQRELLELSLRHGLSHTQIAAVVGLDPEMVSDLCRSAAKRAADLLTDEEEPDGGRRLRRVPADLPGLLLSISLPGPPQNLRERVVSDCVSPAAAADRSAAGAMIRPLAPNGFPLHRTRGSLFSVSSAQEEIPFFDATEDLEEDRSRVPADRVTTFDLPAPHGAEPLSELRPETGEAASESPDERDRRSRWLIPAAAGLATALVAFGLWGAGVFWRDLPQSTVAGGPLPSEQENATTLSSSETISPAELPGQGQEPAVPSGAAPDPAASIPVEEPSAMAEQAPEPGDSTAPPQPPSESLGLEGPPTPPPPPNPEPDGDQGSGQDTGPAPEQHPEPPPVQHQDLPQRSGGVVTTLLDGVLGLLGLSGGKANGDPAPAPVD